MTIIPVEKERSLYLKLNVLLFYDYSNPFHEVLELSYVLLLTILFSFQTLYKFVKNINQRLFDEFSEDFKKRLKEKGIRTSIN